MHEQCSGGEVTTFCRHCTEFICEECLFHQKVKVYAGHKVTSLEELKKRRIEGDSQTIKSTKAAVEAQGICSHFNRIII